MRSTLIKWVFPLLPILLIASWSVVFAGDEEATVGQGSIASSVVSNDQLIDKQWALIKIQAPDAWQITTGNKDILIAVLDTGIDQAHVDLAGKVVKSINLTESPTADDVNGHGTHIAGIIAASTTGLAYNPSLLNVKVVEDDGSCKAATVARGIVWAVDNGAHVINVSLTIRKPTPDLEAAVNYAWNKGSIVVAAAGNNFASTPMYPAAYPNVIAVAATDKDDRLPQWSNHGDWISVGAPGVDIYSTLPGDKYAQQSGTSFAAALTSGEAALLFSIATDTNNNGRVNDEVLDAIKGNCDAAVVDGPGQGRINVLKAVSKLDWTHRLDNSEADAQ